MDFISKIVFTLKQKPARQSQAACLLPGGLEEKRTLEIEKKKKYKNKRRKPTKLDLANYGNIVTI